jgi:hypothetical protein
MGNKMKKLIFGFLFLLSGVSYATNLSTNTICFVYNGGAGAHVYNGFVPYNLWLTHGTSSFMTSNGDAIGYRWDDEGTGANCVNQSGGTYDGKLKIQQLDTGAFDDIIDGIGCYMFVDGGSEHSYGSGYYTAVKIDSNSVVIPSIAYDADAEPYADIRCGGAIATIDHASDSNLMDATNYTRICYVRGDVTQTVAVTIASGGGDVNNHKIFIGVDSDWAPLALGSYVTYDASAVSSGLGDDNFDISVDNVVLKNFRGFDPGGTANPLSNEYNFRITGKNGVLANCKADLGYVGIVGGGTGVHYYQCIASNTYGSGFSLGTHGSSASGCIAVAGNTTVANVYGYTGFGAGSHINNSISYDYDYGIGAFSAYGYLLENMTIIGADQAIRTTAGTSGITVLNSLFIKGSASSPIGFYNITAGADYWEDYNVTDMSISSSGFSLGSNSTAGLTFTNTDPLTDITGKNFKPNRGQTIADTYVIDAGIPLYWNSTTTQGRMSRGAYPTYDIPAKANVTTGDTVYGETGTSAGGGGGAPGFFFNQ